MRKLALAAMCLFATLAMAKHSHHHHVDSGIENQSVRASNKKVIAYFPEWGIYERKYQVADLPADKLTHINYAFARVSKNMEIEIADKWAATDIQIGDVKGNFGALRKLKGKYPNLKTIISVGGWTDSDRFSDVAVSNDNRVKFAASVVKFIKQYGFDGVDIDWEYPVCCGDSKNKYRA